AMRKRSRPTNQFRFGNQMVATKVNMMVPRDNTDPHLDVTAAMHEKPAGGLIALNVLTVEETSWQRPAAMSPGRTRMANLFGSNRAGGGTSRPTSPTTTTSPAGSSSSSWS